MAGLSPGTSGSTSARVSGERSGGAGEACPRPCNRGCAPLECTVKLPKSIQIIIRRGQVEERDCVEVRSRKDGTVESWELSVENFMRTISTCHEVEVVRVVATEDSSRAAEAWKAVCESLKTVASLKELSLFANFVSYPLLDLNAEAIFSIVGANSTVQKCKIYFSSETSTEAAIVRALVDAVLHNPALQRLELGVHGGAGAIGEVSRYMKDPSNVLTRLVAFELSDEEVVQLADAVADNMKLRQLTVQRVASDGSGRGMGRIGEVLCTNRVLEELDTSGTELGGEEMEALVSALIPDPASGLQPNTHLHTLEFFSNSLRNKEGMEQVATLLRSNTSLRHLGLFEVQILQMGHKDLSTAAQMLFSALQSNASLESLDLRFCRGIGGKEVLGMIMDMLLHNHTLREIHLSGTGLGKDGGAEVVYAELRARGAKEIDRKLEEAVQKMEHVPPNSARVFLCGNPEAGKTTLCRRWTEMDGNKSRWFPNWRKRLDKRFEERTRGIEVHKMIWGGMTISVWDMAGQMEYHAFHDMVLPNQCAKGECCFYFIVCNPMQHWNPHEGKLSPKLEDEIRYWLMFLASSTRQSEAYRPHVTILMTHCDMWPSNNAFMIVLERIVVGLKGRFQDIFDLDQDVVFTKMDNKTSSEAARMMRRRVQEYLKQLSSKLPKVLRVSEELQSIVEKWREKPVKGDILKWEVFSKELCEKVKDLKALKIQDEELFENIKKRVATTLHSGGHIMYYEELDMIIMNPHWFCNDIMGNILFECSELGKIYIVKMECGIISRHELLQLWKEMCRVGSFDHGFKEVLKIMTKLQICYEDSDDRVMIPSLLSQKLEFVDWKAVFYEIGGVYKYLGTRLTKRDDTITLPSVGFFARLQVYLQSEYHSNNTYKVYLNAISFIYEDINVIISWKDGSINIMSRCIGESDHANHALHKTIMSHINDLRQMPTLGCPGVILEEHVIWPRCIEQPWRGNFQCVSKKYLREMVQYSSNLKYVYYWEDEEGRCDSSSAKNLLGDEEWQKILQSQEHILTELEKNVNGRLNDVCAANNEMHSLNPLESLGIGSEDEDSSANELEREAGLEKMMERNHKSMKRLIQCNHKEVMDRLREMEIKIIYSQETLAARVCSNIDHLMACSLQMMNSKIPKLPCIMLSNGKKEKRSLFLKMVPGLVTCNLQFRCEHNDHGLHMVHDQPGCEIHIGNDKTRAFGIVMYWGLAITTMLVKVGAHVVAGAGSIVPDFTAEFATILDTAGLLDVAQPKGVVLKYLPNELKKNPVITLEDNKVAIDWLVKLLEGKCKSRSMYEMFRLTEVKYTSKSSRRSEIGWVCDAHKN